jgi:hypothetical protein
MTEQRSVCLCILMNHPFPKNLPILRRMYGSRFDRVIFLIPFDRRPDEPDVVTVYRGSYTHFGFITDAMHVLRDVDCTHFLFAHDDVLLNPSLDRDTFFERFPLGPNDGFFPSCFAITSFPIGGWSWAFNFVPQLTFPKSLLFGAGIERQNLIKYLPSAELVREKMAEVGISTAPQRVRFGGPMPDTGRIPSRVFFHGLYDDVQDGAEHDAALKAVESFVEATAQAVRVARERGADLPGEDDSVELPIPVMTGGFLADFYVVPKSRLADYAHYAGVASAAHLMVEFFAPTLLYAVCDRVWNAKDLNLNFNGFNSPLDLTRFSDPQYMALHPFKLSVMSESAAQDRFIEDLAAIRQRSVDAVERGGGQFPLNSITHTFAEDGWHHPEGWGRWQSGERASIAFDLDELQHDLLTAVELVVRLPGSADQPFNGKVSVNGHELPPEISSVSRSTRLQLHDRSAFVVGRNTISFEVDQLADPAAVWPGSGDTRMVGFGVDRIEYLALTPARSETVEQEA